MYKITINKVIYTKTKKGMHKDFVIIQQTKTTENNLINRLIELKRIYKDFSYNIDFVKI